MATRRSEERGRITARVPHLVVEELEEAAALAGVTVNQFIVQAASEKARSVIDTHMRIDLSRRDAAFIANLLDSPPAPNAALIGAIRQYKKAVPNVHINTGTKKRSRHGRVRVRRRSP